mgnify:CR=1 FL=1
MKRNCMPLFLLIVFWISSCHTGLQRQTGPFVSGSVYYAIIDSIPVPEGYTRLDQAPGSFGYWLREIPVKKDKTVYLFNGQKKRNQSAQFAVLDIPVGNQDLQQCADAVMRLRAQYLFDNKKYDSICFYDNNGTAYRWKGGNNAAQFEPYLEKVFSYCGSASLEKQLMPAGDIRKVLPGEVLIRGGFPGHAMMVVDVAENKKGERVYLLAQSYMPAQDIHIVVNPEEESISPWYQASGTGNYIITPEWHFLPSQLRKW